MHYTHNKYANTSNRICTRFPHVLVYTHETSVAPLPHKPKKIRTFIQSHPYQYTHTFPTCANSNTRTVCSTCTTHTNTQIRLFFCNIHINTRTRVLHVLVDIHAISIAPAPHTQKIREYIKPHPYQYTHTFSAGAGYIHAISVAPLPHK